MACKAFTWKQIFTEFKPPNINRGTNADYADEFEGQSFFPLYLVFLMPLALQMTCKYCIKSSSSI